MLKVDQQFIEDLQKAQPTKEAFAALHADIQPPRPWHHDKLTKFLSNLTQQTKE